MLNQLSVRNYAIVEHLEVEFRAGMSAITGETGAGKSILLGALGLALGDRSDKGVIRSGASKADISARFDVAGQSQARQWLEEHDLLSEDEPELCLLRRIIGADGRSKAYINGSPAPLQSIKHIGEMLIDIHSQHEHQSLLNRSTHLRLLDDYCGQQELAAGVRQLARQWKQNRQSLDDLAEQSGELSAQCQLIRYQVDELDEMALGEGELEALEQEYQQLNSADSSLLTAQRLLEICSGSDDTEQMAIQGGLNQALSLLHELKVSNPHLATTAELLNNASIQVEEAINELNRSVDAFESNPERLEEINQRLADIHQIARKHKVRPDELPAVHAELRRELESFEHSDEQLEFLGREDRRLRELYLEQARALSEARAKGSERLASRINEQLVTLGMTNASLMVLLQPRDEETPAAGGLETVEFLVSTNPGQEHRPLIKIASGGELSRISLAIQVITAQTSNIPSLVFDEVDVGIGGGVAKSVGTLLRQLGDNGQVLCVTHQAQVASQAHHHLYVSKSSAKSSTETRIIELDGEDKVREIARMLGGEVGAGAAQATGAGKKNAAAKKKNSKDGEEAFTAESLAHAREMTGS